MPRKGITVYLPKELEAKVERLAFMQHRSASSVIVQAVRARLGDRSGDDGLEAEIERLSARMNARFDKTIGEAIILKEIMLLFVRIWLEHNPPLEPELEESAAASAEARQERFMALVAHAVRGGRLNGEPPAVRERPAQEADGRM